MMAGKPQNRWIEISVAADQHSVDDLVGLLGRHCVGGAVVEEIAPMAQETVPRVLVKGFLPEWEVELSHKLELALLLLSKASPISAPSVRLLEMQDWAESWKAFFPPQHIGSRLVIAPTWQPYVAGPDEVVIRLDPGMAFGTGLHASTRLCLIGLERLVRPALRVLDVGTGSGILAIAAALLGAGHVDALDTDEVAVEVASQNAVLNQVNQRVSVARGTLRVGNSADKPGQPVARYDLVLANILAEIIAPMSPAIAQALSSGGYCVVSGILREKAGVVADALVRAGLQVDTPMEEEGWVALIGRKV